MHNWTEPELAGREPAPPLEMLEPLIMSVVTGLRAPEALAETLRALCVRAFLAGAKSAAEEVRRELG